jgi:hypothetical protein
MKFPVSKRVRLASGLLVLLGLTAGGIAPSALADGATVENYGTCVTYGIDTAVAAPMTIVVNPDQVVVALPHQSVDGSAPPPFSGGGWSACGR